MITGWVYLLQRLSALLLAPMVVVHLVVMVVAARGGLTAEEILLRTQSSVLWLYFYSSFVIAVSVHAAIGMRVILFETLHINGKKLVALTWLIMIGLLYLGFVAVRAVVQA